MAILEGEKPYSEGTIKLTWADPNDSGVLHSKMFESPDEAIKFVKEAGLRNWLLFKLRHTESDEYVWDMLDNGKSRAYALSLKINDSLPIKIIGASLIVLGVVYVGKLMMKKV
jgi:hypothetical protein